jgi:hypothetical protein
VVEEAPGPDGSTGAAWERPPDPEGADLALAALGDLDARGGGMVGVGDRRSVGGADRTAHDTLRGSTHTAAWHPAARRFGVESSTRSIPEAKPTMGA